MGELVHYFQLEDSSSSPGSNTTVNPTSLSSCSEDTKRTVSKSGRVVVLVYSLPRFGSQ